MRRKNDRMSKKELNKESRKELTKEALIESLKFPKDVCMGALKVSMTGNREAWIENYRGILEYTDSLILLQGKTCQVCFEGTGLSVDYYTNEDMKISGCICAVRYL
jgi:sporulation protein YqfC